MHLLHMIAAEPAETCEIHIGTFSYTLAGEQIVAEFYLKTCQEGREHQFSDYNEQLTDEWESLLLQCASNIRYEELAPCPI